MSGKNFSTADIDAKAGPIGDFDGAKPFEARISSHGWEDFQSYEELRKLRYDWDDVEAVFQGWWVR